MIVNGVPRGTMPAGEYFRYRKSLIPEVMAAYESLAAEYDIIVIEGGGQPGGDQPAAGRHCEHGHGPPG